MAVRVFDMVVSDAVQGVSVGDLARRTGVSVQYVIPIIRRLVVLGIFVKRQSGRRRMVLPVLTHPVVTWVRRLKNASFDRHAVID